MANNEYAQPEEKSVFESSIYQRFKMNSHKILIDKSPKIVLKNVKDNKKLEKLKKKLGKLLEITF